MQPSVVHNRIARWNYGVRVRKYDKPYATKAEYTMEWLVQKVRRQASETADFNSIYLHGCNIDPNLLLTLKYQLTK